MGYEYVLKIIKPIFNRIYGHMFLSMGKQFNQILVLIMLTFVDNNAMQC
jgi:hypothetical protein